MEKIRQTTAISGFHPIINKDAKPIYMSRTVGKGAKGSGNSLPPNLGRYGLGEGATLVHMPRTGGKGPNGNNWKLTHTGPGRASRRDKGSASHDGTGYGVMGVSGGGSSGYGVGGI